MSVRERAGRSAEAGLWKYLRTGGFPTFWCAGCGNGIILRAFACALSDAGIPPHQVVVVTGIGCFGKADDYLKTHSLHGTHGRALAFASGVKAARPDLCVVALMGDGDCATIGGNHLIHACRRDIGVLAIVSNNQNYGMTGGQYSATTPEGSITATSPSGHVEPPFDLCRLAAAAGAGYVARGTCAHPALLRRLFLQGLQRPGFGFVEVLSPCPTHFGRANRMEDASAVLSAYRRTYRGTGRLGVQICRDTEGFSRRYAGLQKGCRKDNAERAGGARQ